MVIKRRYGNIKSVVTTAVSTLVINMRRRIFIRRFGTKGHIHGGVAQDVLQQKASDYNKNADQCWGIFSREAWRFRLTLLSFACALLAWGGPSIAATVNDASEGTTGLLKVKLVVRGEATKRARNNIEWESLAVNRVYQVEFPLIMQTVSAFDPLAARAEQGSEEHKNEDHDTTAEHEYADMAAAMAICNGETACLIKTGQQFANAIQSGQRQMPKLVIEEGNFATWGLPYGMPASCQGQSIILDQGQGVAIDPPKPAHNYSYSINGEKRPSSEADCVATLTYDLDKNTYSFSLPNLGAIAVTATISSSGKELRQINFLDEIESMSRSNGGILLNDIDASGKAKVLEGRKQLRGSVSYFFAQDVVPVTTELSWRFEVK